jgi:large subunit ribosomal protein L18
VRAKEKARARQRRHRRVRKSLFGTVERPRLAVYRSNRHIYAQVIDDSSGRTLAAASSLKDAPDGAPLERAKLVGTTLAGRAKQAGISQVSFDRGGFKFHGQVRAVAEGVREGGVEL